jgi:glutaminyl-tRNA synthetase
MSESPRTQNFLTAIIEADLRENKHGGKVVTRFPPEPNGFLHIGHAKAVLLNYGLASRYGGRFHLRFDDTNPAAEDIRYVESIKKDVAWLGCEWGERLYFGSDFFERMYECAVRLVREGKAYVDSQSPAEIRENRGSFEQPGKHSPFRDRSAAENLELFEKMKSGAFPEGACVLRAKIDMAHTNVIMRDPLLYRIKHAHHHRTGDRWHIYPMYDYAHPLEDAFEGVTHSICTLEFESNRELYDWVLDNLGPWDPRPRQYEFARLALDYTVTSKRKLLELVTKKLVSGWDDPRMPTIAGMRRRGVTADALRAFAELIGVAKNNSVVDVGKLEFAIRTDLEARTPRAMAVLRPLKVTIENWPEGKDETLTIPWWPGEPERGGVREMPFGREVFIEQDDFREDPPADWKRLAPGREVRLMGAYVVRCERVVKDASGSVVGLVCTYDPASAGGAPADGRKVPGTLHWVHATRSAVAEVRLYDRLFRLEAPDVEEDFLSALTPNSLTRLEGARAEPALARAAAGDRFQFVRQGYFIADSEDSRPGQPVWNRTIDLKDSWGKPAAPSAKAAPAEKAPPAKKEAGPPKKGRAEARAELRARTPALAERFERYTRDLGVSKDDADVLTGDLALATYFDAAVAAHPTPKSVARWLLNELFGIVGDCDMATVRPDGREFGRFVALVDQGRLTAAGAKTLLADLVANGGEAEARMRALGLEKREDAGALAVAIQRVLDANAAEVSRYRAGEKKLLGVLLGAAMRETQGTLEPASVKKALIGALDGGA